MPNRPASSPVFELRDLSKMDRLKNLFRTNPAYEPVDDNVEDDDNQESITEGSEQGDSWAAFSWIEYSIFLLLGIAMLWAWNMFLAAAPYFQHRFLSNPWILNHFQPAEISVSTVTNLCSMIALTKLQKGASYPKRISSSLLINIIIFAILAASTLIRTSAGVYFGFLLVAIFAASFSTGLIQNGLFSFSSGFGRSEYTQAIMTGQAVAGVLPPLAQILSVVVVPKRQPGDADTSEESPKSALIYFLTATAISLVALLAFFHLLSRRSNSGTPPTIPKSNGNNTSEHDAMRDHLASPRAGQRRSSQGQERRSVSLTTLFRKLPFLSLAVFICFAVTMIFPVFTASIKSVNGIDSAIFIPLGFLLWNVGDLVGRLATLWPQISLRHYPFALFCLGMARLVFIPLYFLCNIKGKGALVNSDTFYLLIVQGLFGLTNGYLGSECMMGSGDWVLPEEKEAAGGFMGLMLVGGLTVGSLLSFLLGDV